MSNPKAVLHNKPEGVKKENLKLKGHSYFTVYTKIISTWIIDLNVNGKIIKFLGDNRGEYIYDIKKEDFLSCKKKFLIINFEINQLGYIKTENIAY